MLNVLKFLGFLTACVLAIWQVAGLGLSMMNKPNTNFVIFGVFILIAIGVSIIMALPTAIRLAKAGWKEIKKEVTMAKLPIFPFLAASLFFSTGCTRIDAGHVGIVVNLAGDQRGVQDLPAQNGWVWYNPLGTKVFEYPTFVQTAVWTKDANEGSPNNEEVTFNTKDGLVMAGDISLSYQLIADKVPAFYVKFRSDDLTTFTHGYLRNVARDKFNDVAGTYAVEEIYGPKKEVFVAEVKRRINEDVESIGLKVEQFGFIGAPRPPQNVIDSINAKIAATQKAMQIENELRQSEAEAKKLVAQAEGEAKAEVAKAKGDAEARKIRADMEAYTNQVVSRSLTPLVVEYWKVTKWNGVQPQYLGGGNSGLLVQLPASK